MALDEVTVPVTLGQGINTKEDPKQLKTGKLTVLQNGVFQVGNELKKRNGYGTLSQNISGGGSISTGVEVGSFLSELIELDGQKLYSYSSASTNWVNKGALVTTSLSTSSVVRTSTQQTIPDGAINGNYQCFVWYDSIGQIGYSLFDTSTGQSIVNNGVVSANGTIAKVLALGTYFVIIYYSTSGPALKYRAIDITNPTAIAAAVTISTDINTSNKLFDASVFNNRIYIAFSSQASNVNTLYYLDTGLVLSSSQNVGATRATTSLSIFGDASNQVWVAWGDGTNIKVTVRSANLTSQVLAPTTLEALATSNNITGIVSGTTATFYYQVSGTTTVTGDPNDFIKSNTMTLSGTAGSAAVFNRGVGLASKVFSYNSQNYLLIVYQSNLQNTYFLINGSGIIVAKIAPENCGGYTSVPILPEVNVVSSGVYLIATLIKDLLFSAGGSLSALTGVNASKISFVSSAPASFVLGQNFHVAGGIINMYDGGNVVEHGYNVFPEGLSGTIANVSSGGGIGVGTQSTSVNQLQYSAVYEWTDNQGQVHRSAPSVPITLSIPAPGVVSFSANYDHTNSGTLTSVSSTAGMSLGQTVYVMNVAGSPVQPINFQSGTISSISGTTIIGSFSSASLSSTGTINLIAVTGNANQFYVQIAGGNSSGTLTYSNGISVGQTVVGYGVNAGVFPIGTTISAIGGGTISFSNPANTNGQGLFAYYTTNSNQGTITVPTLRLTSKPNVSIVLYRTEVNGTVFYRQSSITSPTYNDKTVDSVTFTDSTPDAVLVGNEQLYTTGEIENIEAPAISAATTFKSRAIVIPSETKYSWQFSKQVIPGSPVEFSDQFVKNIDSKIGSPIVVGVLDEKIIFFGPSSKYYVVGDGPAASGANDDFSQAQHITGSTGCSNGASIIEVPVGLIYQDPTKGIYLLDRSLQEQYIGQDVEAYNNDPITSAQTIPGTTAVRFTLTSGNVLVYDWFYNQWGADPYQAEAIASTIYSGKFTYVQSNGVVFQETPGTYSDNGSFIPLSLTTGWINFSGVQGFQRVLQLEILGQYKSPHNLVVNIYSDFDDSTPTQTVTIPVTSDPKNYQYRIRIARQKCTSIKIQVSDLQSSNFGEGMSLSALSFIVGVKKGLNKLKAGNSY